LKLFADQASDNRIDGYLWWTYFTVPQLIA